MAQYYVQLPAQNSNAMVDFSGLRKGLRDLGDGFEEGRQLRDQREIGNAMAEARYGDAAKAAFRQGNLDTGLGIKNHEATLAANSQKEEQAYAQRVGQYFQSFIEPERDPAKRQNLVNAWIGSHPTIANKLTEAGLDPSDTENVIRFVRAEATPFMTPKDQADLQHRQAQTAAERAREENYRSQAGARQGGESITTRLRNVQSKEEWESPQIQSLVNAAWGQSVPWEGRGEVLQAADSGVYGQGGDPYMPTSEEAELGITRKMKVEAKRAEILNQMYGKEGKAKEGYKYDIVDNEVRQVPTTEKAKELQKSKNIVKFHLDSLASAEKTLLSHNLLERTIGVGTNVGEIGMAANDWTSAVLGLVYERSGKQTAVAEMKQWLDTYGPKTGDSYDRVKGKIQRTRDYYKALTGEDLGTAPKEDPNKSRLYDKYGLE